MNTSRWSSIDAALLVLRVGIGISFVFVYGYEKLFGGMDKWVGLGQNMSALGITFWPAFWGFMGAFAEFAGALLVMFGLLTRPALALLIVTMIVAATSHIVGLSGGGPWHATEMLTVFVVLLLTGPGRYSVDAWIEANLFGSGRENA